MSGNFNTIAMALLKVFYNYGSYHNLSSLYFRKRHLNIKAS